MSRILLTGGAGFIGSHLAEHLLREGAELLIVDDLNDFYPPEIKRQNLESIKMEGHFQFVENDICDETSMAGTFARFQPNIVIHLAARAGVRPSLQDPMLYEKVNLRGTLGLLELSRKHTVKKFIFASSSSIYGITSQIPFSEAEANPNPISPYGVTKLAGEKMCGCYSHLYGISCICLRFFTVYGPRQRPDLAIHQFAKLMEEGKAIPFFGDGSTLRDYTYIEDIVSGIFASLKLDSKFEIFNLGSSSPISLKDLVSHLERAMGRKANLIRLPHQPGDMPLTFADTRKAGELLGYNPCFPIEIGLSRFVEWFRASNTKLKG